MLKKPEKCGFYGIFYHLNKDICIVIKGYHLNKLLDVVTIFEVLQTTLGGNLTRSFRDI